MLSFKIPTIPQSWIDAANKHLSKVGVELDSAFVGQHAETISWAITVSILLVVISLVFFPSNADRKRAEAIKRLAEEAKRIQDRADEAAKRHQKSPVTFTLEKLKAFDGTNGSPIYIAVREKEGAAATVFDVSIAANFYGKGAPYGLIAGRDGTRVLGKMSLEAADAENADVSDFQPGDWETCNGWWSKYEGKYPVVGTLA